MRFGLKLDSSIVYRGGAAFIKPLTLKGNIELCKHRPCGALSASMIYYLIPVLIKY